VKGSVVFAQIRYFTLKAHGGMEVQLQAKLISAPDGGNMVSFMPWPLYPLEKRTRHPMSKDIGEPQRRPGHFWHPTKTSLNVLRKIPHNGHPANRIWASRAWHIRANHLGTGFDVNYQTGNWTDALRFSTIGQDFFYWGEFMTPTALHVSMFKGYRIH
jgi:hypothetical protein